MGNIVGAWFDRSVITAQGPDAATYLQGQLSQDIAAMEVGTNRWSLLLAPTGKMVAWLRVHRVGDESFVLDVDPDAAGAVLARLERFKLRTDATLERLDGQQMLSLRSLDGSDIEVPSQPDTVLVGIPGGAATGAVGVDLIAADRDLVATGGLDIDLDEAALQRERITFGVPSFGADYDDDTIPGELGAWLIESSVSWTKGCYTGQELVARVDSRGNNTPRNLSVVTLADASASIAVGDEVTVGGDAVGAVTSAEGGVALALLKRSVEPGAPVEVGGRPGTATRRGQG